MKQIVSRIARMLARPATERRLLLYGMALPPLLWIVLRAAGFARTLRWLERSARAPRHSMVLTDGRQEAELLRAGSRHSPFGANCLTLALLTRCVLARGGRECSLRIGVRPGPAGSLEAHAWVQVGDACFNDAMPSGAPFLPFDEPIDMLIRQGAWRTHP